MRIDPKLSAVTIAEINRQDACFRGVEGELDKLLQVMDEAFSVRPDLVVFTGCGTSDYLAESAAAMFTACCPIPAIAVSCGELYYYPERYCRGNRVLVVPFTRKSYTTEVRMAIDKVHTLPNVRTLAITCCRGSYDYNDYVLYSPDAEEQSVIMTGTFTSMLYIAALLARHIGGQGTERISPAAADMLRASASFAEQIAERMDIGLAVMLGQGIQYGVALESANKIKEMSITHAEAHHSLEYRHGPMSLADEGTLLLLFAGEDTWREESTLITQIQGYGSLCCVVGYRASERFPQADLVLELPSDDELLNAPLASFAGQLIGYYAAMKKGIDADAPRHLSQAIVLEK